MKIVPGAIILCRWHDMPHLPGWLIAEALTPEQDHSPNWFDARPLGSAEVVSLRGAECTVLGTATDLKASVFIVEMPNQKLRCHTRQQPFCQVPITQLSNIRAIYMEKA